MWSEGNNIRLDGAVGGRHVLCEAARACVKKRAMGGNTVAAWLLVLLGVKKGTWFGVRYTPSALFFHASGALATQHSKKGGLCLDIKRGAEGSAAKYMRAAAVLLPPPQLSKSRDACCTQVRHSVGG